ncbi:MAG: hypothetical protein IPO62_07930 [Saprospiraceae bacterium]|nr:hypothetical protein [Saprospiraceae bacterium]
MRKLTRFSRYSIFIIYKRLALLFILLIHFQFSSIAQSPLEKLLQCTWEDLANTSFYKNDPVVLKIKSDPEFKEWMKYSEKRLVLESVNNDNLLISLNNTKNIRIPFSSLESIQMIKSTPKKNSRLTITGGIIGAIGIVTLILARIKFIKGPSYSCVPIFSALFILLIGIVLLISGSRNSSAIEKLGREVRFNDPNCKCEWFERP